MQKPIKGFNKSSSRKGKADVEAKGDHQGWVPLESSSQIQPRESLYVTKFICHKVYMAQSLYVTKFICHKVYT